ncbi:protein RALF-like 22 [Silene latifolia]|uniref:protein RALF-like 22 n=1 Tax=Silene latifolia TaxID=37657 RepID=UPI003D7842D9
MADTRRTALLILAIGLLLALISTVQSSVDFEVGFYSGGGRSGCKGTVGECLAEADEFEMDSDVHRRILAQTRYISYGALNRNRVPCSRRGASYYNCRPGAQANPYRRGCSRISRCARS